MTKNHFENPIIKDVIPVKGSLDYIQLCKMSRIVMRSDTDVNHEGCG